MGLRGTKSWLVIMAAVAATTSAFANDNLTGPVQAEVLSITDGDTVRVRALPWLDQIIEISVRIKGIDAPELRQPRCEDERALAKQAKGELEALIDGQPVKLYEIEHDKYAGRVVARVLTYADVDIGRYLVKRGFAKAWIGQGKKPEWCQKK